MRVEKPGSRGGKFWIDEHNQIRYGQRPTGARGRIPDAQPVTAPPPTLPPVAGLEEQPGAQEFGQWAPDGVKIYLGQALRYAPCLARIIERYLDMVSRYGVGAAAEAFKQLTPEDVPAASAALGRIRRLAHWDRYGRVRNEGEGTALPTGADTDPLNTLRNPFVKAAMAGGMAKADALLWQQLALRCMTEGKADLSGALDVEGSLLAKSHQTWRFLAKGVMAPGSRGGHIYWKNGRLHYGIQTVAPKRTRKSDLRANPKWQGPSALAQALMRQGRRVQWRNVAGVKVWGDIITASGDMLSVLADDAQPYDLLHTTCVPVQAVLQVRPDADDPSGGGPMEKSHEQATALAGHPLGDRPDDREAETDAFPDEV